MHTKTLIFIFHNKGCNESFAHELSELVQRSLRTLLSRPVRLCLRKFDLQAFNLLWITWCSNFRKYWNLSHICFVIHFCSAQLFPLQSFGPISLVLPIEELRDRSEGKGRHWFFGYLMQVEEEGGVIVRQSLSWDHGNTGWIWSCTLLISDFALYH